MCDSGMSNKLGDYTKGVEEFFSGEYGITKSDNIPEAKDIAFGKHGKQIEAAMLFIDLRESTKILASIRQTTAAKIYKSFLWGISKIALDNNGQVRSFNGDGVLCVFVGTRKANNAVKAAMQMKYFCREILKPKADSYLKNKESLDGTLFDFGIGIDTGTILVVRGGIRGENNNDLVWIGNATNIAVKLSDLSFTPKNIRITEGVYNLLENDRKISEGKNMWTWTTWNEKVIYITSYQWRMPL
jgi:adenylate cyclase